MSRWLLLASLTLLLGPACFSPRYESGRLQCAGNVCPKGYFCAEGRCWRDGETPGGRDGGSEANLGAPWVVQGAAATPSPVIEARTTLSVLGDDPAGEGALTYTWAVTGNAPDKVGYSDNGTNSAKSSLAFFGTAGLYSFTVTLQNRAGLTATSAVDVEVQQRVNDMAVTPSMATVGLGGSQPFTATAFDQFGNPFTSPVSVKWSLIGTCGVVTEAGVFQANSAASGVCTVVATAGSVSVNATVSVGTANPVVLVPIADTYVEEVNPDRNYGLAANLLVKSQSDSLNNRYAYLRFSLAGVPSTITAAKLRLFGRASPTTHQDVVFTVADNTWTEMGLTWRNKPMPGGKLMRVAVTNAPKYHEWDITAHVRERLMAGDSALNVGLMMDVATNDPPDSFESKDAPTNKPQLVLTP